MKQKYAEKIVEAIQNIGEEASSRTYSGRGMYGQETYAVVCNDVGLLLTGVASVASNLSDEDDDFVLEMSSVKNDSMGFDIVYY